MHPHRGRDPLGAHPNVEQEQNRGNQISDWADAATKSQES